MQKQHKSIRGLSLLLVLTIIVGMLQVGQISALAVGGVSNQSVSNALDDMKQKGQVPSNANDVHYLDFSNRADVMGDVDISQLTVIYPNLERVYLDGTNVQEVVGLSSLPSGAVTYADTFKSGKTVTGGTAVYRESTGSLKTDALIEAVRVSAASGELGMSPALLEDGQITIDGDTANPISLTIGGNVPDVKVKELAIGNHSVELIFPYKESSAVLQVTITLKVCREGYVLSPALQTMYHGGTETFTLTKLDEDGNRVALDSTDKDSYDFAYSASGVTFEITGFNAAGTEATVTATAEPYDPGTIGSSGQSGTVTVKRNNKDLATAKLIISANAKIEEIVLEERNGSHPEAAVNSGDKVYIRGGTSVGSVTASNIAGGVYKDTTTYYLKSVDQSTGEEAYIPARYVKQFSPVTIGTDPATGAPYSLHATLEVVDAPNGSKEKVMGLRITSGYTAQVDCTNAVTFSLTNSVHPATDPTYSLDVTSLKATTPVGYRVYALPGNGGYNSITKDALEDAIKAGDPNIQLVADYKVSASGLVEVSKEKIEIVAGDQVHIVAAAYFEEGSESRSFIMATDSIAGWYDTQATPDHLFDAIGRTLEGAAGVTGKTGNTGIVTQGYTSVLELAASPSSAGQDGKIILIPRESSSSLKVGVEIVEKKVDYYLLAPAVADFSMPHTYFASGTPVTFNSYKDALEYEKQQFEADGTVGELYQLNVLKEKKIAIGTAENFRVIGVYNSNQGLETVVSDWSDSVSTLVTIPSDKAVIDAVAASGNNDEMNVAVTAKGGARDEKAGNSALLTFEDANGVTAELKVILGNSQVRNAFSVVEDSFGSYYTADELLSGYPDVDLVTAANPLEYPIGTELKMYAAAVFTNEEYYDYSVEGGWKDYVISAEWGIVQNVTGPWGLQSTHNIGPSGLPIRPGEDYWFSATAGATVGGTGTCDSYLNNPSANPLPATMSFDSLDHPVKRDTGSKTLHVKFTDPLVDGIMAYDMAVAPISHASTINDHVGNTLSCSQIELHYTNHTSQYVTNANDPNVRMRAVLADGSSAEGYVEVKNDTGYELVLLQDPGQNVKIYFEYVTTVNGKEYTQKLNCYDSTISTTDPQNYEYEFYVALLAPAKQQVYLVADGDYLNNTPGMAVLTYEYGRTYRVYPVVGDTRWQLEADSSGVIPSNVTYEEAKAENWLTFMKPADYAFGASAWSDTVNGEAVLTYSGVDEDGNVYVDVMATDRTTGSGFMITLDPSQVTDNLAAAVLSGPSANLAIQHTLEAASLNVVDVLPVLQTTTPIELGTPVEVRVDYAVSDGNTSSIIVSPSYFDIKDADGNTLVAMLPPVEQKHGEDDSNPNNVLRIEPLTTPGNYSIQLNAANNLEFTVDQVGTYMFKLWTVNNDGIMAPGYEPKYQTLTFTVGAVTAEEQTVRYSQPQNLKAVDAAGNLLVQPGTWTTIEETGSTKYLNAEALKNGVLQVDVNPSTPTASTTVVYRNSADTSADPDANIMAKVPVKIIRAIPQGAQLSRSTGPMNILSLAPGETFPLMWVVNYSFADGSANAVVNEPITAWQLHQSDDPSLELKVSDDIASVSGDVSGKMVYEAAHAASGIVEYFWAYLDVEAPAPVYHYAFSTSDTDSSATVNTLNLVLGDPAEDVYVWDTDSGSLVGSLITLSSGDSTVASAVISGNGVKITPVSVGSTSVTVYPTAGGFAQLSVNVTAAPVPHYNVTGKVVATDGTTPVSNAAVSITDGTNTYTAVTDANGDFTVSMPDGTYTVTAQATGFGTATGSVTVSGAAASIGTLTLPAMPTYQVTGTVQKYGGTTSIRGATVVLTGASKNYQVTTGSDGKFTVANVADGTYALTISKSSYISYTAVVTVNGGNVDLGTITMVDLGGGGPVVPDPGPVEPDPDPDVPEHDCPSKNFTDVNTSAWYHESVDYVVENGIMAGISATKFSPNSTLTRAMMVQILYNMEGKPAASGTAGFQDVKSGSWYEKAIAWAAENEIVKGYTSTRFGPNDMVTREQMASILYRYADFKGEDVSARDGLAGFTDVSSISVYARSNMQWAVAKGLIQGRTSTTLAPKGTATRAEVATIITNYCKNIATK